MNTFIVIFNTDNDAQYNTVTSVLKGFNGWAKITDTVWGIRTNCGKDEVRDVISNHANKVLAINISTHSGWSSSGLPNDVNEWLKW